jgi:hypothetical protein
MTSGGGKGAPTARLVAMGWRSKAPAAKRQVLDFYDIGDSKVLYGVFCKERQQGHLRIQSLQRTAFYELVVVQ